MDTRINAIKFKHKQIKGLIQKPYFFILILFLVGIFAYGLYLPWMGFYWDDWPWIWQSHVMGPNGIQEIDAAHRPLSGFVLYLGVALFGEHPLGWQIYAFLMRFLGVISLTWFLRILWPENKKKSILISLLFLLYPGFSQQYVSVNNSRHLFPLITFFLSLGWMVKANRKQERDWFFTSVSLVFSLITMLTTEYYYGLELIRPVLLGMMKYKRSKNIPQLVADVLKRWLPYFVPLIGLFSWRYALAAFKDINYSVTIFARLISFPKDTIIELLQNILFDFSETGLVAWFKILELPDLTLAFPQAGISFWLLVVSITIGMGAYLTLSYSSVHWKSKMVIIAGVAIGISTIPIMLANLIPKQLVLGYPNLITALMFCVLAPLIILGIRLFPQDSDLITSEKSWAVEAVILAITALFLAPIPFWVTSLDPKLEFPADRLTLPMMFGSSLLLIGLLDIFLKRNFSKVLILSSIIGLAVGFHNQNAFSYGSDWSYQIDFFQQLTTRVPGLKPNTAILSNQLRQTRSTDNSLTAPLNWIYAPEHRAGKLPIAMFDVELRFGKDPISLDEDASIEHNYLSFDFKSSPKQSLVIYHQPPACLRVLDADLAHKYIISPYLFHMGEVLPFSKPERIILDPEPPTKLFYPLSKYPQPKDWCYYFEKAALARQREDWVEITRIGAIALNQFESTDYPSEYIPFIEGYAHMNQWEQAKTITYKALEINESITPMLCKTWDRIVDSTPATQERNQILEKTYAELGGCG
ncbi:MAG: hypothetical protein MAG431_02235 [Chloroflexi bacterium]|nr:hypothetical protein [Chloroflexota bacterium]